MLYIKSNMTQHRMRTTADKMTNPKITPTRAKKGVLHDIRVKMNQIGLRIYQKGLKWVGLDYKG